MNKFDEKIVQYTEFMDAKGLSYNLDLLKAVTKGLGPSIHKRDAETVSSSDSNELATVKNNFLIGKLGLEDTPALDEAIATVVTAIGKSEKSKYRAVVYYLLTVAFEKEAVYNL